MAELSTFRVFGFVASAVSEAARPQIGAFCAEVSRYAGLDLAWYEAETYAELGHAVHRRDVDLAWLPPIPYIALDRRSEIVPLASSVRGGGLRFESVIVVPRSSMVRRLSELSGRRAAWVDPHSASGYVFARLELAAAGVDVHGFESETFYGSHEAAVRAVACHDADFAATHATLGRHGEVLRSAWLHLPHVDATVRVLAQLGSLPADVIGARTDLPRALQHRLSAALVSASRAPENRQLMLDLFGVDELRAAMPGGYATLRAETERASAQGLL